VSGPDEDAEVRTRARLMLATVEDGLAGRKVCQKSRWFALFGSKKTLTSDDRMISDDREVVGGAALALRWLTREER